MSRMRSPVTSLSNWAKESIEGQPPHRGRGVEGLGDGDEADVAPVEDLDQLGKIHQGSAEPVDLIDHHHIDPTCFNILQQALERRALQRASRIAGRAA